MALPFRAASLVGVAFLASLSAAPAAERDAGATRALRSDWRVECTNNAKALDCKAFLEVVAKNNRQIITAFTVRYPAETKKPVMMLQLPLGILLSKTVSVAVDDGRPQRSAVQTCTQTGCFVGAPIPNALINAMLTGKQLKIVFYNANRQPVTVTISLAGFALAYNKVKG